MQREGGVLMRKGFGLITAIIILVVVSSLMAMMISLSSSSVKSTTDIYLKEQAELLLRSATEYAILVVSAHDNSVNCIEQINIAYPVAIPNHTHEANITISYLGTDMDTACGTLLDNNLSTLESNLTIIMDAIVSVNQEYTQISEPIRLHRRTIQKP